MFISRLTFERSILWDCTGEELVVVWRIKGEITSWDLMSALPSAHPTAGLETVRNILGSLVARYQQEEVLTALRKIPAREAQFRPLPSWVTSVLAEAYRRKGIGELYSHQATTAEL